MRRNECYLLDMLSAAQNAARFTDNLSYEEFTHSALHQNATLKALEIIGEAANQVTSECKKLHPHIPWIRIIGMRNRIVHAYFAIELSTVWSIVKEELPDLIRELEMIVPPD